MKTSSENATATERFGFSRWSVLLPVLLLFGVLYGPILCAPSGYAPATMFDDFYSLFYPAASIAANLVHQYQWPTWNPYSFCGMPFLASIQMGTLYPPNWLHAAIAPERAFCILLVAHTLLAFTGTWLYCRGRGRSPEASLFAGVVFAVSGRIVLHLYAGHPHIAYSAAWLPFVFWMVDRSIRQPTIATSCCLAVVLALQFLAGFPMLSLLLAYLLPGYLLLQGWPEKGATFQPLATSVKFILAAAILALALAAAQILPTLEYMSESHRGEGLDYGWSTTSSFPPINLLTFLVPGFFGDEVGQRYWGETSLWESTACCGVVTLLLALIGVIDKRPDRETWFWMLSGLGVMLVAMGSYSYVYDFCYAFLPGVRLFRGVSKLSVFSTLALAMLASRGFDAVFFAARRSKRITVIAITGSVLGISLACWALLEREIHAPPPQYWVEFVKWVRSPPRFTLLKVANPQMGALVTQSYDFMLRGAAWFGVLLGAYAISVLSRFRLPRLARFMTLGILALELCVFARPYLQTSAVASFREPAKRIREALPEVGPWRFVCVSSDEGLTNQFAYEGLPGIGGVEASLLTRYTQLFQSLTGATAQLQTYSTMPVVHESLFDLLNVRYYAAPANASRVGDSSADRLIKENVFERHGQSYDLYENHDVLPRAFIVHQARRIDYPEFGTVLLPELMQKGAKHATFVEGHLGLQPEPVTDAESLEEHCDVVDYRPTRLRVDVSLLNAGVLVVNENYYPGWVAKIDGRPAEVHPANFVMRAIAVPAGKHTIEMVFEPRSVYWGTRVTLAAVLLLISLLAWATLRPGRSPAAVARPEDPVNTRSQPDRLRQLVPRIWAVLYHASLIATFFLMGGWLYSHFLDEPTPPGGNVKSTFLSGVAIIILVAIAVTAAWKSAVSSRRRLLFGTFSLAIFFPLTLLVAEGAARLFVPHWPVLGLHGVNPLAAARSWSRIVKPDQTVGLNDWGQRDRSRTLSPAPGRLRIAFVGDSFLEESTTVPVSLRVEQKIGREDLEVINLGVSASGPDDYYHRIRRIAIPLGAQHCVMFIFAGNDFVDDAEGTLTTHEGIAAVYPRGSFLQSLGLLGLNHLLTNHERPVIKAWLGSGDLRRQEEYRQLVLAEADEAAIEQLLLSAADLTGEQKQKLAKRLSEPQMKNFYGILKSPDAGQFRSYYLGQALNAAATDRRQWDYNSEIAALFWVRAAKAICDASNVKFTLVIIPEAFQVDSRMTQQWQALADMRHLTKPCRDAAERLADQARTDGIEVIDLHEVLQDIPGTYLNLDGHWSDKGVEIVSETLAKKLR